VVKPPQWFNYTRLLDGAVISVAGIYAGEFFKPANAFNQVAGLVLGEDALQFGFGAVGAKAFGLGPLALHLSFPLSALSQILGAFGLLLGAFSLKLRVFGAPALFVKSIVSQECQDHHHTS
jgi:hypothetical protein